MTVRRRLAGLVATTLAAVGVIIGTSGTAQADDEAVIPMIVGGHDATEAYPWMASVQHPHPENGSVGHRCGASLIAADWVVTAEHCVKLGNFRPGMTQVRVGSYLWSSGGSLRTAVKIVSYPTHSFDKPGDDVALIQLDEPVSQRPIKISRSEGSVGDLDRILGWGTMCNVGEANFPCRPSGLQEADVRLADDSQCSWYDKSSELCVRGDVGQMGCFGDSGGPLVRSVNGRWQLIGSTRGDGDADSGVNPRCADGTGVWTDLTKYRLWIGDVISGRPVNVIVKVLH